MARSRGNHRTNNVLNKEDKSRGTPVGEKALERTVRTAGRSIDDEIEMDGMARNH